MPPAEHAASKSRRVLSGMRPTGRLHIGNYFGALPNWLKLQNDPSNDCYFFVADWHSLTSDYADTREIAKNTVEVAIDFLAGGLDPQKCTIFLQSSVPEHAELHLLLSMITPLGWLERVPTYKEALENIKDKDLHTYGFLGYPVLQCADIVMYGEPGMPLTVPVGEDQVAHVELSREIVRRFNVFYGLLMSDALFDGEHNIELVPIMSVVRGSFTDITGGRPRFSGQELEEFRREITQYAREAGVQNFLDRLRQMPLAVKHFSFKGLQEPDVMLTETPRIPGTDGRKMSKSYGNAITLSESDEDIRAKTKVMMTDPARKRRQDPGNPDICPVYDWHKLFSPQQTLRWSAEGCRTAGIGCIECKAAMADNLIKWIRPIRARREKYEKDPAAVLAILDEGSKKARKVAQVTMGRVREAVFGWEKKRGEIAGQRKSKVKGFKG